MNYKNCRRGEKGWLCCEECEEGVREQDGQKIVSGGNFLKTSGKGKRLKEGN